MKLFPPLILLSIACVFAGCGRDSSSGSSEEDPVVFVDDDDPAMIAAIAKSRETVGAFIDALTNPKPGQKAFAIKKEFQDGEEFEHMWLTDLRYEDGKFIGSIGNEPELVKNVRMGDQQTVPPAEISDWMYIDGDRLAGGYSIRVLRDKMPADERADFDSDFGALIE